MIEGKIQLENMCLCKVDEAKKELKVEIDSVS
jgi:hypothetical protein